MFGPERLEAIEVKVSNAERARIPRTEIGSVANQFVPLVLRDLATWHVSAFLHPQDFSDCVIVRLVPR